MIKLLVYVQEPLEVFNTITPNGDGFNDNGLSKTLKVIHYVK